MRHTHSRMNVVTSITFAVLLSGSIIMARGADALRRIPSHDEARKHSSDWVEAMKKVHAHFTGTKGTFAHFGDSITVTMAFWSPLAGNPKNMSPEMECAHRLVKSYQKPECWSRWKGPEFGNTGSMTIRWVRDNVDMWIEKLNPEAVLIMFGSNDV